MTCSACASERESRLRAERERDDAAEGFRLRGISNDALRKHLVTMERERDEARAMNAAGSADAGRLREAFVSQADALVAAQKRIEGLEAALRLADSVLEYPDCGHGPHLIAKKAVRAALSSPAVTAEGKKLGEEGLEAELAALRSHWDGQAMCEGQRRAELAEADVAVLQKWASDTATGAVKYTNAELRRLFDLLGDSPSGQPRAAHPKAPEGS